MSKVTITTRRKEYQITTKKGEIRIKAKSPKKVSCKKVAIDESLNSKEKIIMPKVTAEYLGKRNYEVTVRNGEEEIKRTFVEPFFNLEESAKRITAIVESLNVEEDIDVSEREIYEALEDAAKRANKKCYALAVSY